MTITLWDMLECYSEHALSLVIGFSIFYGLYSLATRLYLYGIAWWSNVSFTYFMREVWFGEVASPIVPRGFAGVYFVGIIIIGAWLICGWYQFLLHLTRTGCARYSLLFATSLGKVVSAVPLCGLTTLFWYCFFNKRLISRMWLRIVIWLVLFCCTAATLFAWYFVVDNYALWPALSSSLLYAQSDPLFVLLWLTSAVGFVLPLYYARRSLTSPFSFFLASVVSGLFVGLLIILEFMAAIIYSGGSCLSFCSGI